MAGADAVWQALSHPARRRIVDLLRDAPRTTGALVDGIGGATDRFAVQRHLGVLREAGLVLVTPRGRERQNSLNGAALLEATIGWLRPADAASASRLVALKNDLENPVSTPENKENTMEMRHLDVTQSIEIAVPPERVFAAITKDTGSWWGAPYTTIEGAPVIDVDPVLGGLLSERLGSRQALWGQVSEFDPDRVFGWTGRMGMGDAAVGTVTYTLTTTETGTRVDVHHESVGPFEDWVIDSYDYGWDDLNHRLKALLEDGISYGTAGQNSEPEGFVHAPG